MICWGVLCPLSSLVSPNGLERNPKVNFNELQCVLLFFSSFQKVLKRVNFSEYDVQSWDGLKYTLYGCLARNNFQRGSYIKHYIIQCNGLERSQFLMISPSSLGMVLKEANFVGMYNGPEIIQLLRYGQ